MYALRRRKSVTSGEFRTCRCCLQTMPITNFIYNWDFSRKCIQCTNAQQRITRKTPKARLHNANYKKRRYNTSSEFRNRIRTETNNYRQRVKQQTPQWASTTELTKLKKEVVKLNTLEKVLAILKGEPPRQYCVTHIIPLIAMDFVDGQWIQVASGLHTNSNVHVVTRGEAAQRWNRLENNND